MNGKKLKSFLKGAAQKETFGTNPMDPWSAKYNIAESASLDKYLISKGLDPRHIPMATKVHHAKSMEFLRWKQARSEEHTSELQSH